jgi:hypothetical protein
MRFVANSGKPSRLALDFAPRASSRKHHAAHGAGFAELPKPNLATTGQFAQCLYPARGPQYSMTMGHSPLQSNSRDQLGWPKALPGCHPFLGS